MAVGDYVRVYVVKGILRLSAHQQVIDHHVKVRLRLFVDVKQSGDEFQLNGLKEATLGHVSEKGLKPRV